MNRALLAILCCVSCSFCFAQTTETTHCIRTINHLLAELTTDNEFEKNIAYEVNLEADDQVSITKTWVSNYGDRREAVYSFKLADILQFEKDYGPNNRCSILIKCREKSVKKPWVDQVVLTNEAQLDCLNGSDESLDKVAVSFMDLQKSLK